jgi:hypothetical protein
MSKGRPVASILYASDDKNDIVIMIININIYILDYDKNYIIILIQWDCNKKHFNPLVVFYYPSKEESGGGSSHARPVIPQKAKTQTQPVKIKNTHHKRQAFQRPMLLDDATSNGWVG